MLKKVLFMATVVLAVVLPGFFVLFIINGNIKAPEHVFADASSANEVNPTPAPEPQSASAHFEAFGTAPIITTPTPISTTPQKPAAPAKTPSSTSTKTATQTLSQAPAYTSAPPQAPQTTPVKQGLFASIISAVVSATKPTPTTWGNIFLDNLVTGWKVETTLATSDLRSTNAYDGSSYAIHATYTAALGEVRFKHDAGVDVTNLDGINFYIAGANGGEHLTIVLYDTTGKKIGSARVVDYMPDKKITTNYKQVYIGLVPLNASHAIVGQVVFQSDAPESVYIDNVMFMQEPLIKPTSGRGDTYDGEIFTDDFANGWSLLAPNDDTRVYSKDGIAGSPVIQTTLRTAGAHLDLAHGAGMHTYLFHNFVFWAKGQALDKPITIIMKDQAGTEFTKVKLGDYIKDSNHGDFQKISISLTDLGVQNTVIYDITFATPQDSAELDLDNIHFEE